MVTNFFDVDFKKKSELFLAFFMLSISLDDIDMSDIRKHDSHIFTFIIEKDNRILLVHHPIIDVIYNKFF